jgi:Glycosyltransferase family 92
MCAEAKNSSTNPKGMKYYLSVAAMFRDEARWLREWIEYHRMLGVEHFYLYDHLSRDQPELVLADYISSEIVTLTRLEDQVNGDFMPLAIKTYNQVVDEVRGESTWLALLDVDEFINLKTGTSLATLLRDYQDYGGLVMNWQMFGTGGVPEVPPDQTMLERLRLRGPRDLGHNSHIKSVVQPLRVKSTVLHFSYYLEGYFAVNTAKEEVSGPFDPRIRVDVLQLNHYFCRDLKFLREVKIPRRAGLGVNEEIMRQWDESMNVEVDDSIQRFVGGLKARLGLPVSFQWQEYAQRYPEAGLETRERAFEHWQRVGRLDENKQRLLAVREVR